MRQHTSWAIATIACCAALTGRAAPAEAAMVLFDDQAQNGMSLFQGATLSDEQVYEGTHSVKAVRGAYSESGMSGSTPAIAADESILRFQLFKASGGFTSFTIITRADNTNHQWDVGNASSGWTVNGQPGAISLLTANTWHTVEIDLSTDDDFVAGTSKLTRFAPKPGGNGATFYLDNIQLVPEPASLAVAGIAAVGLLHRRRRA